ncbi:glycosyltransferase [Salinibacter ruber]|uniref:glycosyltransferase n=1 Tax=Salinibacter ruber TaxID=146919 RepID=UPI002166D812|nr:glycosyltransferase [Salinibacter ruber]MCS3697032.1 glycosyltransferase involved in cell wall biosynthesis [Salinibacter ruber]
MIDSLLSQVRKRTPESVKGVVRDLTPEEVWSWMRAYSRPPRIHGTDRFNFFPICHDPYVIYTFSGANIGNVVHASKYLGEKYAKYIVGFTEHVSEWKARYIARQVSRFKSKYENKKIIFLSNSAEEKSRLVEVGLRSRLVNKNSFQREDQFYIENSSNKGINAVMVARMARWKRIELAKFVENLTIITTIEDEGYFDEVRALMDHVEWPNFGKGGSYEYLSRGEIRTVLNRSRTGLILSASEANNKASIEYLLCGVPVVSTPSKGGREVFFDQEYCKIVDPDPEAVREGVEELIAREVDPEYVREQTLDKIRDHRARFLELVYELSNGRFDASVDEWLDLFPRNMKFQCEPEHFRAFLDSDYLRGPLDFIDGSKFLSEDGLRKRKPDRWQSIVEDASVQQDANG